MKLLLQSAMIFFGTLIAAAVVALGEPAAADMTDVARRSAGSGSRQDVDHRGTWSEFVSARPLFGPR